MFCIFSFMCITTGLPVGPIIAVNGLRDAFCCHSHSVCGLVKSNWNLAPSLVPKFLNFALWTMVTMKSYNSGTALLKCVQDVCTKQVVFGIRQSNGIIQISVRPILVAMANSYCHLSTKWVITQLAYETSPKYSHQTVGFSFRGRPCKEFNTRGFSP